MQIVIKVKEKEKDSLGISVNQNVNALLAYWDKDLICRYANNAYIEWFGVTQEELVDKMTIKDLLGLNYEQIHHYVIGVLQGKSQTYERELPLVSGEGVRYAMMNFFPNIVKGKVDGFYVHAADITQIKLLEKEILEYNTTIKNQNERLLNFANIVTHNLRSYANNLGIILDLFITAGSEMEKNEMLNFLKDISTGFTTTIENLTEIVEVQNKNNVRLENINLHDYINRAIKTLPFEIRRSNAVVQNNVSQDINMMSNPAYMDSIIVNFLTNSLKYKHPNRDPVIEFYTVLNDDELILKIKDNGLGIDLNLHRESLFGMYKTFHRNPDAKGIGLFLVRSQVEALGGYIDVESEVDKGTTFSMHFKLSK